MKVLFFGCGYCALASARAIRARHPDAALVGTSRSVPGAMALVEQGIDGLVFDDLATDPGLIARHADVTHIVHSIPPDAAGDLVLVGLAPFLAAAGRLKWIGYYSTIGVYGGENGEWVDEQTPPRPRNARTERRVLAEVAWRDFGADRQIPVAVLRLAGIYGPGRSAFDKLADGSAHRIVKPGQVFNRIHVADIATITALAAERELDGVYNIADDEPAPPQDVITFAAGLMGVQPPPETPFDEALLTPMQRSFYAESRRVSNRAIKQALGLALHYPDYRGGLAAIRQPG